MRLLAQTATETLERRLEFAGLPQGWHAIVAIALLGLFLWASVHLYRRERRVGASARIRAILALLRGTVLAVLALIWLQPVIATYTRREIEAPTLLLIDGSASMSLHDRYADETEQRRVRQALGTARANELATLSRAEIVRSVLARDDHRLIRELARNNPVLCYRFGDRIDLVGRYTAAAGSAGSGIEIAAPASAPATDIGAAVRQAVES
ncbi:MAG: hypothetical protein ACUVXJ_08465, partial [Phycisphaerae bacterium]